MALESLLTLNDISLCSFLFISLFPLFTDFLHLNTRICNEGNTMLFIYNSGEISVIIKWGSHSCDCRGDQRWPKQSPMVAWKSAVKSAKIEFYNLVYKYVRRYATYLWHKLYRGCRSPTTKGERTHSHSRLCSWQRRPNLQLATTTHNWRTTMYNFARYSLLF